MESPPTEVRRLRPLVVLALALAAASSLHLSGLPGPTARADRHGEERESPVAIAAAAFDFHCSTCHGTTGAGFEEARARFPPDHAACHRCHGPLNPPRMSLAEMEMRQTAFSLGDPPPLNDRSRLAAFGSGAALERYIAATMPRWKPGSLDEATVRHVTLYVMYLAGVLEAADLEHHVTGPLDDLPLREGDPR